MTGIPKIHQKKVEPDKAEACTCCFSQVVTSMCGTSLWTNYFNYFCKFQGKEYPTMFLLAMLGASCGHIICSKSNSKIILESHVGSQILIMFSRGNPLVNEHSNGKSPFFMGKSTINGHFQ
jgi:hypothetical protein